MATVAILPAMALVTAVGYMPFLNEGEAVGFPVRGHAIQSTVSSSRLKAMKRLCPTVETIEKYLASGVIKGIRPATAKKSLKNSASSLDVINTTPAHGNQGYQYRKGSGSGPSSRNRENL